MKVWVTASSYYRLFRTPHILTVAIQLRTGVWRLLFLFTFYTCLCHRNVNLKSFTKSQLFIQNTLYLGKATPSCVYLSSTFLVMALWLFKTNYDFLKMHKLLKLFEINWPDCIIVSFSLFNLMLQHHTIKICL